MTLKTERLVNLTIALLETRRPLSLAHLQQKTGYYTGSDHDAARRMFERDKDDLRSMGVPIDALPIPYSDDTGYIINRRQYEQSDPTFTRDEITALALAQQYAQSADVGLAFAKIAARAPDPDDSVDALHFHLRVTNDTYPPDELATAVVERVTVRFSYLTPRSGPSTRTVDPYALARRRGRWYLVGFDHQPAAIRAFRLDRIDGPVLSASAEAAFTIPENLDISAELIPFSDESHTVTGQIHRVYTADIESRGGVIDGGADPDIVHFRLDKVDEVRDIPWLMAFGDALRVTDPPAVVDAMRETFRAIMRSHGDA